MPDYQGHTEYIAFLDECGDHSLTKIDKDFPLFVLSLVLAKRDEYLSCIIQNFNHLKLEYWDHEGVNLHSRDIRKASGPFSILQNPERRMKFMGDITEIIEKIPFQLFIVGIRKDHLCDNYLHARNPYQLALTFAMERIVYWMEHNEQVCLPIVAEARGKNEDNELKAAFFDLTSEGTPYVSSERFRKRQFPLQFHDKRKNIAGIQLADLCAHPAARQILKPEQTNRAYSVIEKHIYKGESKDTGWKVFP